MVPLQSSGYFYLFLCSKRTIKKKLLVQIKTNVAISGRHSFDREADILKDNRLSFIPKNNTTT
jgi:DNA-directed RNA polymerase alpha subunit